MFVIRYLNVETNCGMR